MGERMNEVSSKRTLTLICYLCYFFTGSLVTVTGVVLGPIATYYHYRPGTISYIFTAQNGAMFLIIIFGGLLMKNVSLKKLFLIAIFVEFAGLAILQIFTHIPVLFILFMGIIGFSGGIFMGIASFLIVHIYNDPKIRSTRMVMADFFFSFSGIIIPFFAAQLLKHNVFWLSIYYFITISGILILFLVIFAKFPNIVSETHTKKDLYSEKWGIAVYLIAISCFFFIGGELIFAEWLPLYLQKYLLFSEVKSANFMSMFWIFMAVGLFAGRFIMKYFRLGRFILFCFLIATISLTAVSVIPDATIIMWAIMAYGLFNSIIYACMLAYGSLQVKHVPPTLMAFVLGIATLGTMFYAPITGYISNTFSIHAALNTSWVFYLVSITAFFFAFLLSKAEKIHTEMTVH